MTQYLPPNLLALFAPRDPIKYLPPNSKLVIEKKTDGYAGVSGFLGHFEDPKDTPPPTRGETKDERLERKRREKADAALAKIDSRKTEWDPSTNPALTTDAFKTLFVARINYDTSESKLRREFEHYGPIRMIHMVHCKKSGKPRGYAFIEYEHERDMHNAYKSADGKKIDNRRVLVDVERSRTVKGWFPRSLGGGLGGTRRGAPDMNTRHSGREDPSGSIGSRGDEERGRDRGRREERRPAGGRARSRSRSRERKRDRDKERDQEREQRRRERERREYRDRDRDRDRRRRRDRDRDRRDRGGRDDEDRKPTAEELESAKRDGEYEVKVKEEKPDDYPAVTIKEQPETGEYDTPKDDGQSNGQPEAEETAAS